MNAHTKQRLLALLEPHKRKPVARVMERRDAAGDAVYDLAGSSQAVWTPGEWSRLLNTLSNSTQTVGDWIESLWVNC